MSCAILDKTSLNAKRNDSDVQVWLFSDDADYLMASLSQQHPHSRLDVRFQEGSTVSFYTKGMGTVYLYGYKLPSVSGNQFGDKIEDYR